MKINVIGFYKIKKINKPEKHKFNDFFSNEGRAFEWDSQPSQHINTRGIKKIANNLVETHLMARQIDVAGNKRFLFNTKRNF